MSKLDKRVKHSAQKEKDRIRKRIRDLENELSGGKHLETAIAQQARSRQPTKAFPFQSS
jgi:guanylate kinase